MITDNSLERINFYEFTEEEINNIFVKIITGKNVIYMENCKYSMALLITSGKMYSERKMIMQLHIGALRSNNIRMGN